MKAPHWLTRYVAIVSLIGFLFFVAFLFDFIPYTTGSLFLIGLAVTLPTYLGIYAASKTKNHRLASNLVRAGLFLDSQNTTLIFVRAQLRLQKNDFDGAEEDINFLITRNPKGYHGYNLRTLLNLQRCDFSEAEEDCERILKIKPNMAVNLLNRAVCRMQLGKLDAALADCEAAAKQNKNLDDIKFVKFATLVAQQRHDQAEVILQELSNKKSDPFYVTFGTALMQNHYCRYEEVLKICAEYQDEMHAAHFLSVQVLAYLGLNEGDLALSAANHLVHRRPNFYSGYMSRAAVLIDCEMYDEAQADLNMLESLQPYLGASDTMRGIASFGQKRYEEAIEASNRSLEKNARNFGAMILKARALLELSKIEEAQSILSEAQMINPQSPYLFAAQAVAAAKVEGAEKAVPLLSRALEVDPHFREGYKLRSQVFDQMGDHEKAALDLQRYQKLQKQLLLGVKERLCLTAASEE